MTKKLGIVLPTYNRRVILESTLTSLIPLVEKYKDYCTLVVCDNASTDGTDVFMKDVVLCHPGILKYYRHDSNRGYLYNFKFGIEHVDAEYIFLHGDDDLILPYFFNIILEVLDANPNVSLIHFNYFISSLDGRPIRMAYKHFCTDSFIYRYNTFFDFIKHHFDIPSFMSSLVFKKECWMKAENDKRQYKCIAYEWLYIVYKGCIQEQCIFIELPLFLQRMSKYGGYSSRWTLYSIVGISRVFECLGPDYFKEWKLYRKNYSKPKMMRNIACVYLDKTFYRKQYKFILSYLDGKFYKVLLFCCVYIIPAKLQNFVFLLAKRKILKH